MWSPHTSHMEQTAKVIHRLCARSRAKCRRIDTLTECDQHNDPPEVVTLELFFWTTQNTDILTKCAEHNDTRNVVTVQLLGWATHEYEQAWFQESGDQWQGQRAVNTRWDEWVYPTKIFSSHLLCVLGTRIGRSQNIRACSVQVESKEWEPFRFCFVMFWMLFHET